MRRGTVLALVTIALGGCNNGAMGNPGSVLWSFTATASQDAEYQSDREGRARLMCAQDYSGEGYEACVRNSMKY